VQGLIVITACGNGRISSQYGIVLYVHSGLEGRLQLAQGQAFFPTLNGQQPDVTKTASRRDFDSTSHP